MIAIEKTVAVRRDTEVGLEFQGLTGIASVSLKGGTPAAPVLEGSKDNPPESRPPRARRKTSRKARATRCAGSTI